MDLGFCIGNLVWALPNSLYTLHVLWDLLRERLFLRPKRPHRHKDLTFWFQGPISAGCQKSWLLGSLCLCGLLGPHLCQSFTAEPQPRQLRRIHQRIRSQGSGRAVGSELNGILPRLSSGILLYVFGFWAPVIFSLSPKNICFSQGYSTA